jgi:hypothetical protein
MSVIAWRLMREERLRSAARIAALAAAIDGDRTIATAGAEATAIADAPLHESSVTLPSDLFAAAEPQTSRFRLAGVAGAGALVVAIVIGVLVVASASRPAAAPPAPAAAGNAAEPQLPLELVALGHEREPDRLTVRGVIRNPSGGSQVGPLTAVVMLFNHDGGFIASGRVALDGPSLGPGGERTFVVSVPAGGEIGRYRVSFRSDDRVVPHVDRRS